VLFGQFFQRAAVESSQSPSVIRKFFELPGIVPVNSAGCCVPLNALVNVSAASSRTAWETPFAQIRLEIFKMYSWAGRRYCRRPWPGSQFIHIAAAMTEMATCMVVAFWWPPTQPARFPDS